jgi:hypothetical protein
LDEAEDPTERHRDCAQEQVRKSSSEAIGDGRAKIGVGATLPAGEVDEEDEEQDAKQQQGYSSECEEADAAAHGTSSSVVVWLANSARLPITAYGIGG